MKYDDFKEKMLRNPETRAAYDALALPELDEAISLLDTLLKGAPAGQRMDLTEVRRLVANVRSRQIATLIGCGGCGRGFRARDLSEDGWCIDCLTAALRTFDWVAPPWPETRE